MIGADRWIHKTGYRRFCSHWWKDLPHIPGRVINHRLQRMIYGWSTYDMINGDTYLADVIANTTFRLFTVAYGHPMGMTYEEWLDTLLEIYDGFSTRDEHGDHNPPAMAWDLLREHFSDLWD